MGLGLGERFHILERSPHDRAPAGACSTAPGPPPEASGMPKLVPSRYTVRANTDDGQLVLWNSFTGAMSAFPQEQAPAVLQLLKRKGYDGPREGLPDYLSRRGFLVRENTDEYRRFQQAFGQQHYRNDVFELILLASEDCNFRCTYCYETFPRGTMEPWVREAVKKATRERIRYLRRLTIKWFGGEPLYGMEAIDDLGPFFQELAQEHGVAYRTHMTTNGYLLTPDVADKLLAWQINHFQITLDGPAETHDCSRPTRTGESSFQRIFDNLCALSRRADADFKVSLRVNFDRDNAPLLPGFLDQIREKLGGDPRFELRFHPVGRWGGKNDDQLNVCGEDEKDELEKEMRAEAHQRGLRLSGILGTRNMLGAHACYAARPYNFIIGATGKIMKCTIDLDTEDRNIVGQITTDGTMLVDQSKMGLWTEPAFEADSKCQKCVVLPVCQGIHCPLERILRDTSPCTSTRTHLKTELLEAYAYKASAVRKVEVGSNP